MANNDISSLLGQLLSSNTLNEISKTVGVSKKDTKNVLVDALPQLLSGANNQVISSSTVSGFLNALTKHASDDSSNITNFFSSIDLADGGKIVKHLLGGDTKKIEEKVAKSSGVDVSKVGAILSSVAPLLLTLLGKQVASNKKEDSENASVDLLSSLLGGANNNVDFAGLASSFLKTSDNKKDNNDLLSNVAGIVGKLLK